MTITLERLKSLLRYEPETGIFTWLVARRGLAKVGGLAGTKHNEGYWQITVDGRRYLSHRLAWLYMTGSWPEADIDHRNGIRGDCRFTNLREATRTENKQNENAPHRRSRAGLRGVSWHKAGKGWEARIRCNGTRKHLGVFATKEEAHFAYVQAKAAFHPFATDRT